MCKEMYNVNFANSSKATQPAAIINLIYSHEDSLPGAAFKYFHIKDYKFPVFTNTFIFRKQFKALYSEG